MTASSVTREIIRQVDSLPPALQRRVLDFTQSLAATQLRGAAGKDLLRFAGAIPPDDLRDMAHAIEQGCERMEIAHW